MIGIFHPAADERSDPVGRLIRPEARVERQDADVVRMKQLRSLPCHLVRHGEHRFGNPETLKPPDRPLGGTAAHGLAATEEKHDVGAVLQARHGNQRAQSPRELGEELLRQHVGANRKLQGK